MTESFSTLQTNGSGVHAQAPAQPRPTRTLLPSSWLRRSVEVSLLDGDSFRGELLDWCGCGPVLATRLSASETTRRVCSWDAIKFVDLRE